MNYLDFTGKTVLVVGGSSGIGNGIAQAYRANGATVHVWGTRKAAADYSAEQGSDLSGLQYDQVDASDEKAVAEWAAPFEALDVLVLAQGIALYKRAEYTMAGFHKVVSVNLDSLMACAIRFHDMLAASKGALITISSAAAFHSSPGNPGYNASKAGAVGLTRSLADAWAKEGIRVNGIAPGLVATKLTEVTTSDPKRLESFLRSVPLGRLGTPAEIAGVALFLGSSLASYVIGQTIPVDGGLVIR